MFEPIPVTLLLAVIPAVVAALFAFRAASRANQATIDSRADLLSDSRKFGQVRARMRAAGDLDATALDRAAHDLLFDADLAVVLFNFSPDAIIVADSSGRIALSNRRAELLSGYTREELYLRNVDTLLPERLRERHPGHRRDYMNDPRLRPMGAHLDLRMLRNDDTEVAVDINLSPVATARGLYVIATIRDKAGLLAAPAATDEADTS